MSLIVLSRHLWRRFGTLFKELCDVTDDDFLNSMIGIAVRLNDADNS